VSDPNQCITGQLDFFTINCTGTDN